MVKTFFFFSKKLKVAEVKFPNKSENKSSREKNVAKVALSGSLATMNSCNFFYSQNLFFL